LTETFILGKVFIIPDKENGTLDSEHLGGLEPAEKQIEAGGFKWNYLEWNPTGTRNILLVHGITSDARTWWHLGPDLAQAGARVLAVDMPGHGYSEDSPEGVEWPTTAAQLASFVAAMGLDRTGYRLCGHSWGGAVSLTLAANHPAGLERVALLDPALHLTADWATDSAATYQDEAEQPKKSWEEYLAWAKENMPTWTPSDHYWKAGAMLAYRPETVRDFFRDNSDRNITELLGQVEVPLLLVISDEKVGGVIQAPVQEAARAALKPATGQAVRYEGVGHNLHREDYGRLVQDLKPFLLGS
jgi:pimeloyl-ACP methyl ester carboxylesterase